jgi:ABC-type nickel/cobalt efflux system permease component RcnA
VDGHSHDHGDGHGHDHGLGHGHTHPHAPHPGSTISWRSLFLLGLAGGLIPSTSALLILLGSIAAGRPAFGFVLVVAFGLGMAAVMSGIGLVLVAARDRVDGASIGGRLTTARELVPLVASVVVLGFGVYLTAQALVGTPAL